MERDHLFIPGKIYNLQSNVIKLTDVILDLHVYKADGAHEKKVVTKKPGGKWV